MAISRSQLPHDFVDALEKLEREAVRHRPSGSELDSADMNETAALLDRERGSSDSAMSFLPVSQRPLAPTGMHINYDWLAGFVRDQIERRVLDKLDKVRRVLKEHGMQHGLALLDELLRDRKDKA